MCVCVTVHVCVYACECMRVRASASVCKGWWGQGVRDGFDITNRPFCKGSMLVHEAE